MKVEMVGGPQDGRVIDWEPGRDAVLFPAVGPASVFQEDDPDAPFRIVVYRMRRYRRRIVGVFAGYR